MTRVPWPCCPMDGGRLRPNEDLDLVCPNGHVVYRQPVLATNGKGDGR